MILPKTWRRYTPLIALLITLTLTPNASAEEALGRLFFTPERRQALDRQRQLNIQDTIEVNQDPRLTINGIVTRSSGKRTSWINGTAQNEHVMAGGVTVTPRARDPGQVVVEASDSPATNARVGETINRSTGEAKNLLNDGQIVVTPAAARK
jgi:hypothetical protein